MFVRVVNVVEWRQGTVFLRLNEVTCRSWSVLHSIISIWECLLLYLKYLLSFNFIINNCNYLKEAFNLMLAICRSRLIKWCLRGFRLARGWAYSIISKTYQVHHWNYSYFKIKSMIGKNLEFLSSWTIFDNNVSFFRRNLFWKSSKSASQKFSNFKRF